MDDRETVLSLQTEKTAASHRKIRLLLSKKVLYAFVLVIMSSAGLFGYLSFQSLQVRDVIGLISQVESEAEQLRSTVTVNMAVPVSAQRHVSEALRKHLLELNGVSVASQFEEPLKTLILQGRQFTEKVDKALMTGQVIPQSEVQNISLSSSPNQFYTLKNDLLAYDFWLSQMNLILMAVVSLSGVMVTLYAAKRADEVATAGVSTTEALITLRGEEVNTAIVVAMPVKEISEAEKALITELMTAIPQPAEPSEMGEDMSPVELTEKAYLQQEPIFDVQYILDNMDGDKESVIMLLDIFLEEHSGDGDLLKNCIEQSDFDKARLLMHSLKGVASNLGSPSLRSISERVEYGLKKKHTVTSTDCMALSLAIKQVVSAVEAYLEAERGLSVDSPQAVDVEGITKMSVC
ncbi:Hpt domain-containing protein [Photobacterium sp.]|uniref:Hpt domain-containing protein n=1 Tax=Photobacterium sp. TaxID=660 RepID=UPI00299E1C5F|nr:Hpt domain-containing protein [Photobacterium sp.]MDX1303753.1 Hpt domain-containing protein [Photobacterium sp.]